MNNLEALLNAGEGHGFLMGGAVAGAIDCLNRFTSAFNACDFARMDAELHFPHLILSANEQQTWSGPGQHPAGLFESLRSQGWASTQYESIEPVLMSSLKVHFLVIYTRRRVDGSVISTHENVWVVVMQSAKWGILVRSY